MATIITSECINCGACEPECPNTAIYQGGVEWELNGVMHPAVSAEIFYIVPEKCTECVGFFDHEACAAVCPVDCCVPDPAIPESEAVLLDRAKQLHPEQEFPADFPSRFKGEGGGAAVASTAASPAAPSVAAPAAVPAAQVATAAISQGAGSTIAIPEIADSEVPIECHHCFGSYGVAFRHFRSGVVFYCPYCSGSLVVSSQMYQGVAQALEGFHRDWTRVFEEFRQRRQGELEEFEERQKQRLEEFNASLVDVTKKSRPAGSARKRAGIFG